jgi:hypothetical protein
MRDDSEGKGSVATERAITYLFLYTVEHGIVVAKQGIDGPIFGEQEKEPLEDPN